jgi:broad specificity phosphatase PhoE
MEMERTWYLVRHGQTEWNAASRMQGQLDSPLTPRGLEHARGTGRLLARLGVDTMFASPLGRVRQTVDILNEALSLETTFDERLKEWSAGEWSGELYADIRHKWPDHWATWDADRYATRSPGGESFVDLVERSQAFVADARIRPGARIAVVAHGFLNRALATVLLSLSVEEMLRIRQGNDTVIRISERASGATVDYFLDGGGPHAGLPSATAAVRDRSSA